MAHTGSGKWIRAAIHDDPVTLEAARGPQHALGAPGRKLGCGDQDWDAESFAKRFIRRDFLRAAAFL